MEIAIGLIGAGTVGGGVVKILEKQRNRLFQDQDLTVRLARIVDKDPARFAALPIGNAVCTTDAQDILQDESIQIVIELVGGTTFAREFVVAALERKKHVITANKALLAEHGPQIFETATKNDVSVYFEAAVGGGMPVIKAIREGLTANEISSVKTIINGTCNYILTKMGSEGLSFESALREAQKKGYAEADPTLDVSGNDSGHKVAIIASLIAAGSVPYSSIPIEGITSIGKEDIAFARELGYTIKLLGIIKNDSGAGQLDVRVHPVMLHDTHILASVSDVFNAVLIQGDAVGQILLYGRGAGELPTASAVLSDIVDAGRNIAGKTPQRIPMSFYRAERTIALKPIEDIVSRYYLRFTTLERRGVFAAIAGALSDEGISLASVMQKEVTTEKRVPVIILTHTVAEKSIRAALNRIESMDILRSRTQVIRIED